MPPEKLLSCPFCGSDNLEESSPAMSHPPRLTCNNCYCMMAGAYREDLYRRWNTRTPSPELVELRKEKERLDWLSSNLQFELVPDFNNSGYFVVRIGRPGYERLHMPLRTSIDAAMKEK
jgi:hypothetical protein